MVIMRVSDERRAKRGEVFSWRIETSTRARRQSEWSHFPDITAEGRVRAFFPVVFASVHTEQPHHQRGTPCESEEPKKVSVGRVMEEQ